MLEVRTRTGKLVIDYDKCVAPKCDYACVKADRIFGRNVLMIERGVPRISVSSDEVVRLCNECLACEIYCEFFGGGAIKLVLEL